MKPEPARAETGAWTACARYDKAAATLAWKRTFAFFEKILGG